MKRIWITWERQRRNFGLSKELSARLYVIEVEGNWFSRYLISILRTLRILNKEKPQLVFAQNPSIVLALLMIFLKYFFDFKIVIDAHNSGIWPLEGKSRLLNLVSRFIQQKSNLTLITNMGLKRIVERNRGIPFILPDRIPKIPQKAPLPLKGKYNFLFVCTFTADEPYEEVFEAVKELSDDIVIYVTGNYVKSRVVIPRIENLILMGFIPEKEYFEMLNSVNAVITLTKRDNCLVCGAYETVAVGNVLILSNRKALSDYFYKGAIYVENTKDGIANGINECIRYNEELIRDVKTLKKELDNEWEKKKNDLESILQKLYSGL